MSKTLNHIKVGIHNRLLVLNQIRLSPGITRAELARDCKLTAAAVGNVVECLLQAGYVLEPGSAPLRKRSIGRPSSPLMVNPSSLHSVGLSCDLRYLQGSIVNLNGEVVAFKQRELPFLKSLGPSAEHFQAEDLKAEYSKAEQPKDYLQGLSALYQDLCKHVDTEPIAVGLAAMGPLDIAEGKIYLHSSCREWQDFNFVAALQRELGLPVLLEKNSTAAALYEVWNGTARKHDSILYIYLGHGVGGALILNNEIFRGPFANSGEIGHLNVVPGGKPCLCGRRGCLETYLSFDALEAALPFELPQTDKGLAQLLQQEEPHFMAWLRAGAELLCCAVASAVNLLDLSGIMLSGLFPESILQFLLDFLAQNMDSHVMKGKVGKLEYLLSRRENQPSLGAALLPICESLNTGLLQARPQESVFQHEFKFYNRKKEVI